MRKIYLLLTLFVLSLTNMWADTVTTIATCSERKP